MGYWTSSLYSIGGAFVWECCGETHPMSFNDMVSTSLGGITLGEMQYRMSSKLLDSAASGKGRFWREAGAFLIDPIRGLNRILSGRASASDSNPHDPMDWRPPSGGSFLAAGVRVIGQGESISENTKTTGYFEFSHAFDNARNKPYDSFDLTVQLNFGDKVPLGQARVQGTIYKRPFGGGPGAPAAQAVLCKLDAAGGEGYQPDPLVCTRCGQRISLVAFVTDFVAIRRILDHLGLEPPASRETRPAGRSSEIAEHGEGWGVPADWE